MAVEENEAASFEDLIKKLEECAGTLDKGGLPLEEAIKLYEEGMTMAASAAKRLKTAELRIEKIKSSYKKEVTEDN